MSIVSELKKRAGPRVRTLAASPGSSSSGAEPVILILTLAVPPELPDAFAVARLLTRAGVPVRTAKRVIEDIGARGLASCEAPSVADYSLLKRQMRSENVVLRRIASREIDVKALRARIGISQEAFAGRYGLDLATVRNWEQGRTRPDGPAAALLQLIDRDPDKIVELLAS
jgi:DNA-binding transcriptional regulator YiaG